MKILICLASLFALLTLVFAQEKRTAPTSALQAMVDTERAFSKRSTDEGVRPAFLAFIADDGILFRPNAVNGKQWFGEHPAPPPSDTRPLLTWYPSVADISLAGDMGYTTGPWERRNDIHDADAVAWGNFLTVWKRQPDNSFKFVIDLGISNPQPEQVAAPWQPGAMEPGPAAGGGTAKNRDTGVALTAREREFSAASATRGAQTAFAEVAASDVRLFRNGRQPIVGKAHAVAALNDVGKWTWEPAFADVARSGDLGYSYGSYELTKADPALKPEERVERGNYFRIWKRVAQAGQRTSWKIVTDLLDPVAPPKKN
jgi:ketosteroid isomerase-like protein